MNTTTAAIYNHEAEPMTIEEADELLDSIGDEETIWLTTVDRGIDGTDSTLWVEAARRVSPRCCANQSDPGPAWGWVQHGRVVGSLDAQCGGCGGQGLNWVTSGPVEVGELGEVTLDELERVASELVERLDERVEDAAGRARDEIRERLRGELERALEIMAPDDLPHIYAMAEPGVGVDEDGVLVAWDFDPLDEDEIIEVRADTDEAYQ